MSAGPMMFHTHDVYIKLIHAGYTEEQATALIDALIAMRAESVSHIMLDTAIKRLKPLLIGWQIALAISLFIAIKYLPT